MADLPSGQYTITAAMGQFPIGRTLTEDRSLSPKRVLSLVPSQDQPFEAHTRVSSFPSATDSPQSPHWFYMLYSGYSSVMRTAIR